MKISDFAEVDVGFKLGLLLDEFVIPIDMIGDPKHVTKVVQKLHTLFQRAIQIEGREMYVFASFGASIFPKDGKDADELKQKADQSMYYSRIDGEILTAIPSFVRKNRADRSPFALPPNKSRVGC
jgi:GGDEF domain-containing protein